MLVDKFYKKEFFFFLKLKKKLLRRNINKSENTKI
jgi:hypothetical protein